jgi:hypothetical protein
MSTLSDLQTRLDEASADYEEFASRGLKLDITRGKPSPEQLDLAADLLTTVTGDDAFTPSGVDTRNYGGLEGISELREIFAPLLRGPVRSAPGRWKRLADIHGAGADLRAHPRQRRRRSSLGAWTAQAAVPRCPDTIGTSLWPSHSASSC